MVRGEEVVATADEKMGEAEGGRGRRRARRRSASGGRGRPWTMAPTPSRGGDRRSTSPGAGTIRPGGPRGKERTTVEVGANGRRSGGGGVEVVCAHLDGRGDATDATPLAPPSLLSSSSSSSAIAEVDIVGGVTSSVDADLDVVPATKEDVVDADDDGATVTAVIATPDTTGGDDAREAIVLALSSLTRHALSINSIITSNEYIFF